jgi:phage baseplate assembly protein W
VEAVRRSVRNLVNFNFYEKPFHPEIGSGVRQLLFEPVGDLTAIQLQNAISETIRNFEPRVDLSSVTVTPDNTEENYYVAIQFNIKNVAQPYQIDTTLQRLR